jgi:hypothetical protein
MTFARPWNGGIPTRGDEWVREHESPRARARFWLRVEMRDADECWPWHGSRHPKGYGNFMLATRASIPAHRYSFYLRNGELPSDQLIRHTCDNPCCVNPHHLLAGSHADNARDAKERGRNTKGRKLKRRR